MLFNQLKIKHFLVLLLIPLFSREIFPQNPIPEKTLIFNEVAESSNLIFTHFNGMTGKLYLPEIKIRPMRCLKTSHRLRISSFLKNV